MILATMPSQAAATPTIGCATILHLLGLNHEQLTYRHAGRDFRLTDVAGEVMKDIVA